MAENKGYGQFCPISVAAEVVAERWTPLVLRGMFCGARRFNEIQASVPRMSSALLSRRLKELEYAQVIERKPASSGRGFEYALTEAGQELFPTLDAMGTWAQKWLRREIVKDKNHDPDVFFWELRQSLLGIVESMTGRKTLEFQLHGAPAARRFYWLVLEPDGVDVCTKDPGFEVDLWVSANMRTFVEIWLGHLNIRKALDDDSLTLDGERAEIEAFCGWFPRSHFATVGELPPAR